MQLFPENIKAFKVYSMVIDQVLTGPDGNVIGYDLVAIYTAMKIVGVIDCERVYEKVKWLLEDE